MIEFDGNGNLTPHTGLELNWTESKDTLIGSLGGTLTREELLINYFALVEYLQLEITPHFVQFVNGSFTTAKAHPNDIDVVIFIDYQTFERHNATIQSCKSRFHLLHLDCYFEKVYPPDHEYFIRYRTNQLYWNDLFTKNRKRQKKGYLKIIFGHGVS
ncbi:DUF6932 family protein [Telluribacter sp.]|jgi:hypothetical protein|uniref:DUF6932 family protein n=1 Tax=Telluribacter sp. TaxID=1978767 RepID=UPI002E114BD1|nr:hypothetical protein [Telluribacter sp.]